MATTAASTFDLTPPTEEQFSALAADLSNEERHVLLEHGTEAPFCGTFLHEKRPGVFTCRLCGLPLFHGGTKFESGTGWPSFTQPFA
jgi:peptide-methionine (R)-S-oxide reductase